MFKIDVNAFALYFIGLEVWSNVEELFTQGNLMDLGIMEYTELAQCLGNDVWNKYQVYNLNSY